MTLQTFGPGEVGKKNHVKWPIKKHVENSLRGSVRAKNRGCRTNDLDLLPDLTLVEEVRRATRLGTDLLRSSIAHHIHNEHWEDPFARDGFRDPHHVLGRGDLMSEMTADQIDRLVAGWRVEYHIPTVEQQLRLCGRIDLQALLEPKHGRHPGVWERQEVWDYLAETADHYGCRTAVYALWPDPLEFARKAGFRAWLIH